MNREKHVYERVEGDESPSISQVIMARSVPAAPPPVPVRMPKCHALAKKKEGCATDRHFTNDASGGSVASPPEQPPPEEWRVWIGGVVNQMSADIKSMSTAIKSMSADIRRLTLAIEGDGRGGDEERGRRRITLNSIPGYYGTVGSGRLGSFSDRFLQTSSWKRSGTDRIFPGQFRRQGICWNLLESAKTVPESRGAIPEPTQISTDPVAGMIDLGSSSFPSTATSTSADAKVSCFGKEKGMNTLFFFNQIFFNALQEGCATDRHFTNDASGGSVASPPEQPPPEEWRVWFGDAVNQMSADIKSMSADIRRLTLAIEGGVVNQMSADIKSMSADIKSVSADIRRLTLAIEGGGGGRSGGGGGRGGGDEERGRRGVSVGGRPRPTDLRLPLRRP
ncbi:unnamed protein product [Adineta ricciae]|uniref:Uncharacterized protein n=1 Tax=Adineta ricciae TaxID=249248 RepID=A0A814UAY2_ADIRI|nr:unnamed protein product [Adineta ricciae]CAF1342416.1 unnamed protein product [Adineta ricciae]